MSEFPPEWEVYGAAEYELFGQAPLADAGIVATLCIQVSPAGRVIDHFKITLSGSVLLDVNLPLATLLPLPAPHDEYLFHFQVGLQAASPGRISPHLIGWTLRRCSAVAQCSSPTRPARTLMPPSSWPC